MHHSMCHCTFNILIRLSKRGIIPMNIRKYRTPPLHGTPIWEVPQKAKEENVQAHGWDDHEPHRKSPGDLASVDQMISYQPMITPPVTGTLTLTRFWYPTFCGTLCILLLNPTHEGNIRRREPPGQGSLWTPDGYTKDRGLILQGG